MQVQINIMAFPVMSLSGAMDFIFGNIMYFVIGGVALFAVTNYFRFGSRKKVKIVNVADIERMKFIERMKNNKSSFKWLHRDKFFIGKIVALRNATIKGKSNPEKQITQMIIKPMLSQRLNIPRPFSKLMPLQLDYNMLTPTSPAHLNMPAWITFDYFMGIYYGSSHSEETHKNVIIDNNLFRSTAQQIASTFFSKSQEQSTFDPEHAHALAMKEKELQIQLAAKKGKITSI